MNILSYVICSCGLWASILAENHYNLVNSSYTSKHLSYLKNETRSLFDHGWNSYMQFGYPADEVMPITCKPYSRDGDIFNIHRNDVLGNYSVTLLDTITTFAIMGDIDKFKMYIEEIKKIDFNLDSTVQVFETAIRALGSLLSAHLYAMDKFKLPKYDGFLLRKAFDLGERLLPSYLHESGIPLARVNLRYGSDLPNKLIKETCSAGAGSPIVEMSLLSILTNDTRFETYSRNAFLKLWDSRSKLDLLPMTIDPLKGNWLDAITGIGASIDSFYEYALKGAILFNDDELLNVWEKSYRALSTHSKVEWFFGNVHVDTGLLVSPWIDALSAFFPGLLVLSGNIEDAKRAHLPFLKLWNQYQGIPERWDFLPTGPSPRLFGSGDSDPISLEWYPLRPEFIESTYYLYRATKDPFYLRIGEQILDDYKREFKVECGFAGFRDVRTRELQDRIESFVLSETFMYLYLLFDEANEINSDAKVIFSTEGHPLWVPKGDLNRYQNIKMSTLLKYTKQQNSSNFSMDQGNMFTKLYEAVKGWSGDKFCNISNIKQQFPSLGFSIPFDLNANNRCADVCEVPKLRESLFSSFMERPDVFLIDSKFYDQWKHKFSTFELESSFYNLFVNPNAYCQRESTSQTMEFLIGDRNEIPKVHLEEIESEQGIVNVFADSFVGLRMKIELLTIGSVDTFNKWIDADFLKSYQADVIYDAEGTCKPEDEIYANSVLRVRVINGVLLHEGSVVYFSRESLKQSTIESLGVTGNGYIKIENTVVTNMKILD